jgi:hypothetical protein
MADYIENFASKLDFAMPFQRTGKFPLDRTDLFSSYADAVKYAAGDTADPDSRALCGTSYVGQVITVFENDVVTVYKIGANRQLESIGGAYILPKASATELGGIKVGAGLNISEEGTLSATGGGTADAVEWANVIDKPTKLSQFTNDLEFIDKTVSNLVNYYDKTSVDQMIGQIATLSVQKVDSLPVENIKTNVIYLIAKAGTTGNDLYTEYMYIDNKWEILGDTSIDLTNYLTKTGDASATTAAFTAAAARALPVTGESLAIIIGKVIKYLADLKDVAFSGDYNDLSNKPNSIKYHDLSVTTATATYTAEGTVLNVSLIDATTKESVLADVTIEADNKVTIICAEAPANALTARITYVGV